MSSQAPHRTSSAFRPPPRCHLPYCFTERRHRVPSLSFLSAVRRGRRRACTSSSFPALNSLVRPAPRSGSEVSECRSDSSLPRSASMPLILPPSVTAVYSLPPIEHRRLRSSSWQPRLTGVSPAFVASWF